MGMAADDGVIATAAAKGATVTTYSMAGMSTVLGWLSSMDWVTISGVCLGGATFVVNWYYKRRRDARDNALADLHEELERQRAADEHEFQARDDKRKELESQAKIALMQHQMHTEEE